MGDSSAEYSLSTSRGRLVIAWSWDLNHISKLFLLFIQGESSLRLIMKHAFGPVFSCVLNMIIFSADANPDAGIEQKSGTSHGLVMLKPKL
jgi:hypothetical protein